MTAGIEGFGRGWLALAQLGNEVRSGMLGDHSVGGLLADDEVVTNTLHSATSYDTDRTWTDGEGHEYRVCRVDATPVASGALLLLGGLLVVATLCLFREKNNTFMKLASNRAICGALMAVGGLGMLWGAKRLCYGSTKKWVHSIEKLGPTQGAPWGYARKQ